MNIFFDRNLYYKNKIESSFEMIILFYLVYVIKEATFTYKLSLTRFLESYIQPQHFNNVMQSNVNTALNQIEKYISKENNTLKTHTFLNILLNNFKFISGCRVEDSLFRSYKWS